MWLSSDGIAWWLVAEEFTTTCNIKPQYFPFDIQQCALVIFGATTMVPGYENFSAVGLNTKEYLNSSEWTLLETTPSNVDKPFKQMHFTFKFKRTSDFYVVTMIVPLIALSILGLLMFPLPADSGEKISL